MKTVAVETLRESLDLYLDMVTAGERVQVTRGADVIAEIKPPTVEAKPSPMDWIEEEIRAGRMIRATNPNGKASDILRDLKPGPPIDSMKILDEIRADRF